MVILLEIVDVFGEYIFSRGYSEIVASRDNKVLAGGQILEGNNDKD
jgi:hypothetical protein